jgi:ssRNA-specific RNase YbeY (16S rRNA maturation enzyme)
MMIESPSGPPGTPDFERGFLNVAAHGLGHGLGFDHNTIGLMEKNAAGTRPTNNEMETLARYCAH